MRCFFLLVVMVPMIVFCTSTHADPFNINVDFEDIAAGTQFQNHDLPTSFVTEGVTVRLTDYTGYGNAQILVDNYAGGIGNELCLWAGVRAELDLGLGSTGGFFYFAAMSGGNYLEVNGALIDFGSVCMSTPGSVAGVGYSSCHLSGSAYSVKLSGPIETLAFRGVELAIERINLTIVPEPSSLVLLCGVLAIMLCRRRPFWRK